MAQYNDLIGAGDVPIPVEEAASVITDATQDSTVLLRSRNQPMSTKTYKQPVLATLPEAYWVNGDTGLKQTTKATFEMPIMTAEELATIAVVPDAIFDDTNIPLWETLRPLIAEAIGAKVDSAALFGVDKPTTWPTALVPGAVTAGNTVTAQPDLGVSIAELGEKIAVGSGYNMGGFVVPNGFRWRLNQIRASDGHPVYDLNANTLYGLPADEVKNGSWAATDPATTLIGVDWDKVFTGVRQDITIKILDQAVITDQEGKVIINLAQQDARAMRVVFRVGYQVYNPVNRQQADKAKRFPAGIIRAAAPDTEG